MTGADGGSAPIRAPVVHALLFAAALVLMAAACSPSSRSEPARPAEEDVAASVIRFLEARVAEDPLDSLALNRLGGLYLARAQKTGDPADVVRAGRTAEQSLEAVPAEMNSPGLALLGRAANAAHRFAEGRAAGERLRQIAPTRVDWIEILADALVELGRYEEAETVLDEAAGEENRPTILARRAGLAELRGKPKRALDLVQLALREAQNSGVPAEGLAWYHWRTGDLAFHMGDLEAAERGFEAALASHPGSALALSGLADVRSAEGEVDEAIALQRKAVMASRSPRLLADLADLLEASGRREEAERFRDQAEEICRRPDLPPSIYRLELASLLAARGRNLDEAIDLARKDLEERKGIHGYDVLAWALYGKGRYAEAAEASRQALRLGTFEPEFIAHAAMIRNALGDREAARREVARLGTVGEYLIPEDSRQLLGR